MMALAACGSRPCNSLAATPAFHRHRAGERRLQRHGGLATPAQQACEGIWSNLKRSLANLTKQNIDQLTALVKTRLRRMQYRPGLLDDLIAKTGLDLLQRVATHPARCES